jgi:hypothetical protein
MSAASPHQSLSKAHAEPMGVVFGKETNGPGIEVCGRVSKSLQDDRPLIRAEDAHELDHSDGGGG